MFLNSIQQIIQVHDLSVIQQNKPILWNIHLNLPKGKLIGVIGPNGAGKSTLLKALMGLINYQTGTIRFFEDQPIEQVRKRISYMPQKESLDWDFPASVLDIVMMGRYGHLGLFNRPSKADKEIVMQALEQLGISHLGHQQIAQLSGGQQQRVILARSIAQQADLYLMDEPLSAIDARTEQMIITLFQNMVSDGKTIIVVHHNLQSAVKYFDWVVLLNMRLIAAGPCTETLIPTLLQETYNTQSVFSA